MTFNCKYYFKTIYDIGLKRLVGRIIYEIRKAIENILPTSLISILANTNSPTPHFKKTLNNLKLNSINHWSTRKENKEISFKFLNVSKNLYLPINWNEQNLSQLWRFNLHYFDWAREFIEKRLENDIWPSEAKNLKILIDDWIENNKLGKGDGWHSYTISLRIRNWILIIRTCPEFNKKKYIDSLWLQICWLYSHKEDFLGGNHWLENLISLIIGSIQFEGKRANMILNYSLKELEEQLNSQILEDGGHQERSSSYHLLILERLVELGLIIENILGIRPDWLIRSISKMKDWVVLIRLKEGNYPMFNDSPNISSSIDEILEYSNAFLKKNKINNKGLKTKLTEIYINCELEKFTLPVKKKLTTLINTGWSIVRFQNGIEFIFKYGDSCPKHLPAHAHSDLFSFDIYRNGEPIFVETGTSTYGYNSDRVYERSSAAHNIFQLAPLINNKKENIKWIEPIEVWSNFRAARKAKIIDKLSGIYPNGNVWIEGRHDAFERYGAKYTRFVELEETINGEILFKVIDKVDCKKSMLWRQFWHLGPSQKNKIFQSILNDLHVNYKFEKKWLDTYYSSGFGKKIKRKTLELKGIINPGIHQFKISFIIPNV